MLENFCFLIKSIPGGTLHFSRGMFVGVREGFRDDPEAEDDVTDCGEI